MVREEVHYWLALKLVPRLAISKKLALLDRFGLQELFTSSSWLAGANLTAPQINAFQHPNWSRVETIVAASSLCQSRLIFYNSPDYPELLRQLPDPPLVLFVQGNAALLTQSQLAIVGSRFATAAGRDEATAMAQALAQHGLVITSGLAIGIDGAAHRGALLEKSGTVAVVATGLDQVYPARHKQLAQNILASQGCIVSEFEPGTPPKAGHFPRRNRLISGLSLGVLVVEAAMKSGSLITARCALEQNREVFAMPGTVHNPQSKGCHWLIKQGAKLVEECADIMDELDLSVASGLSKEKAEKNEKTAQQDLFLDPLLASVDFEITPVDMVVSRCKLPTDVVLTRLTMLELRGLVSAVPGGYLRLNRG
ncbi:DNA-processing protein DprA [Thalassomonas haliotis]|uniref:DNA-protecting protein DprA n=1 Tax=Thalassomonas haliotis TaxID=485448 RepID=A0ABY7VFY1_9GAMM|nr:DNA-processing protein DprA [Thalassomonas haliotis]WDE11935.1 DNA-protecting protein DprA [Thalassomonas haliotis]